MKIQVTVVLTVLTVANTNPMIKDKELNLTSNVIDWLTNHKENETFLRPWPRQKRQSSSRNANYDNEEEKVEERRKWGRRWNSSPRQDYSSQNIESTKNAFKVLFAHGDINGDEHATGTGQIWELGALCFNSGMDIYDLAMETLAIYVYGCRNSSMRNGTQIYNERKSSIVTLIEIEESLWSMNGGNRRYKRARKSKNDDKKKPKEREENRKSNTTSKMFIRELEDILLAVHSLIYCIFRETDLYWIEDTIKLLKSRLDYYGDIDGGNIIGRFLKTVSTVLGRLVNIVKLTTEVMNAGMQWLEISK